MVKNSNGMAPFWTATRVVWDAVLNLQALQSHHFNETDSSSDLAKDCGYITSKRLPNSPT
jgi:hypothetical protein